MFYDTTFTAPAASAWRERDVIECCEITARRSDLHTVHRRVLIQCYSFTRIDHAAGPLLIYTQSRITIFCATAVTRGVYRPNVCILGQKYTSY